MNGKNITSSSITGRMKSFATKVSMILGITAASNGAMSAPTRPELPSFQQELAAMSDSSTLHTITSETTLPPKAPVILEQKVTPIEPLSAPSKLRLATAVKGESVHFFMSKNFGTPEGWQFLVEKETGKRVRKAERDLGAGKTYILARDEKEAQTLASIFKKQIVKKENVKSSVE